MLKLYFEMADKTYYTIAYFLYKGEEKAKNVELWEGLWEILPDGGIKQIKGLCDFVGNRSKVTRIIKERYGNPITYTK